MAGRRKAQGSEKLTGRLSVTPQGYGFVILDQARREGDVFIPASRMKGAADGDRVGIRLRQRSRPQRDRKNSLEGEIVEILSRATTQVVGKIFRHGPDVYVVPLDERYNYTIRLQEQSTEKISDGQVVAVNIVAHPGTHQLPVGQLLQVLGDPDDPDTRYKVVCFNHKIPEEFSSEAMSEAQLAEEPRRQDHQDRMDLREWLTMTIDGESARDFDDAVSIRKRDQGGFQLGVHIADVSYYVPLNGALDADALTRGTSVYFPDRAVPMLPERLSNLICSLQPGSDRLAVSVVMDLDRKGALQGVEFFRSIIHSRERLTYENVNRILVGHDQALRQRFRPLVKSLEWMLELSELLREKRKRRGSLDLDLPEPEVCFNGDGVVTDIVRSERNQAHRIIEEFMLLANETVAGYLDEKGCPLLYRVHEDPDESKVEEFLRLAVQFGYGLEPDSKGAYPSQSFQKVISQLEGKTEQRFLSYLMLRSFKQAHYSARRQPHFGLASDCYTHFTSPIRRYPDLVIHRYLVSALDREGRGLDHLTGRLPELAEHCSEREQEAVAAEREILRWLMVQFMGEKLGEEFEALIIGVRKSGFFVELLEHFVEGFVPVTSLTDDAYRFHEKQSSLVGRKTKISYRIGDRLRVRVDRTSLDGNLVELSPVSSPPVGADSRQ